MTVHIVGMGVIGSVLAVRLGTEGIDFTWEDNDSRVNAWQASTGSIYPDEHNVGIAEWTGLGATDGPFADVVTAAHFWFSSKTPPSGGRYRIVRRAHGFNLAEVPSLHVNVQALVGRTRTALAPYRRETRPPGARVVIAHGFDHRRLHHYVWGWSARVRLGFKDAMLGELPNALYFRKGRFVLNYAYPCPGTDECYAGSAMIAQRDPKPLAVEPKLARWLADLEEVSGGAVLAVVNGWDRWVQGWRPVAATGDDALVEEMDGELVVRPMAHSGVRYAPAVAQAVLERL